MKSSKHVEKGWSHRRFDCKNPFLQPQESKDKCQESLKTKNYEDTFCRVASFPDFLQDITEDEMVQLLQSFDYSNTQEMKDHAMAELLRGVQNTNMPLLFSDLTIDSLP